MTKQVRKKHTEEFRREAVWQMEPRGERSVASVAESLGVYEGQLYAWRKKYRDTAEQARTERGESPEVELKRLRREVAYLKRQQEILKKATAFFARESDK